MCPFDLFNHFSGCICMYVSYDFSIVVEMYGTEESTIILLTPAIYTSK